MDIGIHEQTIVKWESGHSKPNKENSIILAKYFGVDLNYLLYEDYLEPDKESISSVQEPEHVYERIANQTGPVVQITLDLRIQDHVDLLNKYLSVLSFKITAA